LQQKIFYDKTDDTTKMIQTNAKKNTLENITSLPKKGQIIEGRIIGVGRACVYVDLSPMGTGIIYGKEYYLARDILSDLKIGDKISAKIVEADNEDGYIELSLKEAQKELGWGKLKELKENFETVIIKPNGANKGGLLAELCGVKGFLPLSQLSIEHYPRVEEGNTAEILRCLQQLVGKELKVKILDVDPRENKLIFSEKAVESRAIQELLKNYKPGDVVEGIITGIADFGAFIKFPLTKEASEDKDSPTQMEGLIHISELDWQLINDPSEIVKVGQKVKAKIVDISKEGRVSLSLKALQQDPWKGIEKKFKVGDVVKGKVIKINQFGVFVEIAPKIRGLVHISEFGSEMKMKEVLKEGETYQFKISYLDPKEHRLTLKLKIK
jgi:small subunit ribosomal protein S1